MDLPIRWHAEGSSQSAAQNTDDFMGITEPPCECETCERSFLSVARQRKAAFLRTNPNHQATCTGCPDCDPQVSPAAYRTLVLYPEIAVLSTLRRINENQLFIQDAIEFSGNAMLRKWKKASQAERRRIIAVAWPRLTEHTYADEATPRVERISLIHPIPASRVPKVPVDPELLLIPWLDPVALATDTDRLVALLHLRSAYDSQNWFAHDFAQLEHTWNNSGRGIFHDTECMVTIDTNTYGMLVPWDEATAHRLDIVGFPRAYQVLYAQQILLTGLAAIVAELVPDPPPDTPEARCETWNRHLEKVLWATGSTIQRNPALDTSFAAPLACEDSLSSLIELAHTQMDESSAHLELLQCDPVYIRHHLKELKPRPAASPIETAAELAGSLMAEISNYMSWEVISKHLEKVVALLASDKIGFLKYADHLSTVSIVARRLLESILEQLLRDQSVSQMIKAYEKELNRPNEAKSTPRKAGRRARQSAPSTKNQAQSTNSIDPTASYLVMNERLKEEDPVIYAVVVLNTAYLSNASDGEFASLLGELEVAIGNIGNCGKKKTGTRLKVSTRLLDQVASMAHVFQIICAIEKVRPYALPSSHGDKTPLPDNMGNVYRYWRLKPRSVPYVTDEAEELQLASNDAFDAAWKNAAEQFCTQFLRLQPPQGPRGIKWLQYLNETHDCLDAF